MRIGYKCLSLCVLIKVLKPSVLNEQEAKLKGAYWGTEIRLCNLVGKTRVAVLNARDGDGAPRRRKQPARPHEEQPVGRRRPRSRCLPAKHIQLMPQHGDLGFQLRLRPQWRC
jgi:hypothetical protein